MDDASYTYSPSSLGHRATHHMTSVAATYPRDVISHMHDSGSDTLTRYCLLGAQRSAMKGFTSNLSLLACTAIWRVKQINERPNLAHLPNKEMVW